MTSITNKFFLYTFEVITSGGTIIYKLEDFVSIYSECLTKTKTKYGFK